MMKKQITILGIYLMMFSLIDAKATENKEQNDPFQPKGKTIVSHEKRETHNIQDPSELAGKLNYISTCHQNELSQGGDIPFSELKFIGVLIDSERTQAIFSHNDNQIFHAYQGDFVSKEKLQVKAIHKRGVELNHWEDNDCDQAKSLNLNW